MGPNPLHSSGTLCFEPAEAGASVQWEIYGVDRTRLFDLDFGSDPRPCWQLRSLAPGIYFVRVTVQGSSGTNHAVHKLMVIP